MHIKVNKDDLYKSTAVELYKMLLISENDIKKFICTNVFIENGLYGLLGILYNGSPFKAINAVYPGRFNPW
ncbi:hypothetical protein LL033_25925 (plasmid) [Clostridium estertheticum]|uniref:hypothetical protein n=1 Tax=Clostridium estertheticum TaxID=238834 RepID=UPI001C0DC4D1|nr:hypothetical protein [Clostridium estertheticum]MBU3217420.1 hypothetical protein [Clostridium estertheticum]WAG58195.1 hypothetical protein LL033_25925 [Clostridium estertheticum]